LTARNSHFGFATRAEQQFETSNAGYDCCVKRGANIMNIYRIACLAIIGLTVLMDPAFAGPSSPAPGPIVGIGLPALALIGGAYWVGRKLFARKK
jgi:hypothetical protein